MDREQMLARASREAFDLLVIGGGITGLGIARDAALRGLRVAVVEKGDFASGTSSRSTKLIHGGLRYLRNGELRLVREAVVERQHLIHMAPHIVQPLPFVFPVYKGDPEPLWQLQIGLTLYDVFAGRENVIPHRMYSGRNLLEQEPLLRRDGLVGGAIYGDGATDDGRVVLEVLKSAVDLGVVAVNYVEAIDLRTAGVGRLAGVRVRERLRSDEFDIRADTVLTAAGPWVDHVRRLSDPDSQPLLRLTKGVHITVPHSRLPLTHAVTMRGLDSRIMFAVPSGAFTYLGTTDTDHHGEPEDVTIDWSDVAYILAAARRNFPLAELSTEDVTSAWVGLRPLIASTAANPSAVSRDYQVHREPSGLITVAGGKLTAFRAMAEKIVDDVFPWTKDSPGKKRSKDPLPGATHTFPPASELGALAAEVGEPQPEVERAVRRYGSAFPAVLEDYRSLSQPGGEEPRLAWLKSQLRHAVREEMALRLDDVLRRRTSVMLFSTDNGLTHVQALAAEMGRLLDWTPERVRDEVARYERMVEKMFAWRTEAVQEAQPKVMSESAAQRAASASETPA